MNLKTLEIQRAAEKTIQNRKLGGSKRKFSYSIILHRSMCHPKSPLMVLTTRMQRMLTLFKKLETPQPEYIMVFPTQVFSFQPL